MKQVPKEDLEKIRTAAPDEAPVTPEGDRVLLVIDAAPMYYHDVIPWGNAALEILGQKTGAFRVHFRSPEEGLLPANLELYDAVCFQNTCGDIAEPELIGNLIDYVRAGGGFVGIHCSAHTMLNHAEYGELNGAYSQSHPWVDEPVTVRVEDPGHPCVAAFPERFEIVDEIYEFTEEPYSRKRLRVLVSLDPDRTDMNKDDVTRADMDYPLSWVQQFGKGRSFYTAFGHYAELMWNPMVLKHYLAGIQFTLGDLNVDTTPSEAADER